MNLKRLADLQPHERNHPCQEYPGEYLIFFPEELTAYWNRWWYQNFPDSLQAAKPGEPGLSSFAEVLEFARGFIRYLEKEKVEFNPLQISIAWHADSNDPRRNNANFLCVYTHGRFSIFGNYTIL